MGEKEESPKSSLVEQSRPDGQEQREGLGAGESVETIIGDNGFDAEPEQQGNRESLPVGKESILFVDDENIIASAFQSMLEKLGYRVTAKTSSVEALEIFRASPEQFDLVITDETMPQMTGTALSNALMAARGDILIILCTGYSDLISESEAKKIGIQAYAVKPVMIKDLAKMIREVLQRKR